MLSTSPLSSLRSPTASPLFTVLSTRCRSSELSLLTVSTTSGMGSGLRCLKGFRGLQSNPERMALYDFEGNAEMVIESNTTSDTTADSTVEFYKSDGSSIDIPQETAEQYTIAGMASRTGDLITINGIKYIVQGKFCDLSLTSIFPCKVYVEIMSQELPIADLEQEFYSSRRPEYLAVNDTASHNRYPGRTFKLFQIEYKQFQENRFSVLYYFRDVV